MNPPRHHNGGLVLLPPKHTAFYHRVRKKIAAWLTHRTGLNHKWSEYVLLILLATSTAILIRNRRSAHP